MGYKVYMAEVIHPDAVKKLSEFAEIVDNFDHIEELDGILLRAHHLNREQISRAKKCKVIARHGVGMDILDVAACKEFGIPIVYTPGANTFSVAEFAFTMALCLMRNVYQTEYIQKTQGFKEMGPVSLRGNEMRGKTVGIVGASGRIGTTLAGMFKGAFGCQILGYAPHTSAEKLAANGIEKVETIPELISRSDVVSINCPLTDETRNLFNAEMFSLESGEIDFGWSQSGMAAQAVEGVDPFDTPHTNISSVVYGYPNVCQIVVTADSGIETVDQLAGHTFSVGGLGSAAELNMRDICSVYGLDYVDGDDFRAEFASDNDYPDMISNKQIDGGFSAAAIGASAVVNVMTTGNCKLLSLSDEAIDALIEMNPAYFEYTIEAGTYANQDYDVKTVAVANYIYCRSDLDDTTVQVFLDSIFNNIDELALSHSAVRDMTFENAVSGLTVPLHPAAEAYYKEVGVLE